MKKKTFFFLAEYVKMNESRFVIIDVSKTFFLKLEKKEKGCEDHPRGPPCMLIYLKGHENCRK